MQRLEHLLSIASSRQPDAIAIRDASGTSTYRVLWDMSSRLAQRFQELGVRAGDRVAIWAVKSAEVVAAMQAALRLGAAYVPIDPLSPWNRAQSIIEDCQVRLLVTSHAYKAQRTASVGIPEVLLEDLTQPAGPATHEVLSPSDASPDSLAFILYTSGSTGKPKGVCISHRNALAFVLWARAHLRIGPAKIFANHAPFHFDLSVLDLYCAFATGGSTTLIPESDGYHGGRLVRFVRQEGIAIWYSVPSVLVLMMDQGGLLNAPPPPQLEHVIFAGEPFPLGHLRRLRAAWPHVRFWNFFGPTETNVCTAWEVDALADAEMRHIPIGSAASGDTVWVQLADGSVGGVGEEGELVVDGPSVALGYWGEKNHRGPYLTGDLCRLRADGTFDFLGRKDQMIKLRGFRIEPVEVEAVLSLHEAVQEVAVALVGSGVDAKLVAFVVPRDDMTPTLLALKSFSSAYLPRYMLIDRLKLLEALPRTSNGKVDRNALSNMGTPPAADLR